MRARLPNHSYMRYYLKERNKSRVGRQAALKSLLDITMAAPILTMKNNKPDGKTKKGPK